MSIDARLRELGLELPPPPKPMATYSTAVRTGDLLYVSGTGPLRSDGGYVEGRLGEGLAVADGQAAARLAALAMLATVRAHAGSLDAVARIVKVLGFVNATPGFRDHPAVMNGFSDLMVQIFGEAGRAARSAVGAPSLPSGIAVEVEAIFELRAAS
jgi:enamine deaminase RidA (YjgF/YER057c/UK114 family)